jgi:HlyD family secretion protein
MSTNRASSWLKWLIVLAIIGAAGGGGYWYYTHRKTGVPEYQTEPATRGDLQQVVTASGQLDPVVNVQVGSQISGIITNITVDFNSVVKSNQIIAQIDPATYEIGVLKARAQLSNSLANLALTRVQARRADALFKNKLLSDSDHDTAIAQNEQAEAQVQIDEASLKSAEVDLSRCTIYAPVDGVVISRDVDIGQTVAASFSTPTLFLIANNLAKMQIDALVSEADIGGVIVGQNVTFGVDAYPYRKFNGVVSQVRYGPITNQNVVNYDAVIAVKNDDLKLLPGMTANVNIIEAEADNVVMIPNAALRFHPSDKVLAELGTNSAAGSPAPPPRGNGGGPPGGLRGGGGFGGGPRGASPPRPDRSKFHTVYVLSTVPGLNKPELKPVRITTGISDGVHTEVTDGLKEGDEVVIASTTASSDSGLPRPANPFGGGGFRR